MLNFYEFFPSHFYIITSLLSTTLFNSFVRKNEWLVLVLKYNVPSSVLYFNIYRDKFILSPLNLCDLTYSKYTPIEMLNQAIFSRLEKFQLLIFWKRLSYKSCNFANFLGNIGGASFFQFFPATKAIKDADRIKLLRLSAQHIVLPVSNHDGMRQICNLILL